MNFIFISLILLIIDIDDVLFFVVPSQSFVKVSVYFDLDRGDQSNL